MVDVLRDGVGVAVGREPVVGPQQLVEVPDAGLEVVVRNGVEMTVDRGQAALGLEIEEIVVEHVAVLQVLVGPVAGQGHVDQAARVELPGTEQMTDPLECRKQTHDELVVGGSAPQLDARDHEPEVGIDPARGAAVADATGHGVDVGGNLTVRALVPGQRRHGSQSCPDQLVVAADDARQ
jgi:hypothetical protein